MSKDIPQISFHGGVGMVTGANFLYEFNGKKILIDCGISQGSKFAEDKNKNPFPYDPASIDVVLVTHAHMDHIGRIPKLVREGFSGSIFSTKQTKEIAPLMYEDAIKVMKYENPDLPEDELLYESKDADKAMSLWKDLDYHEVFPVVSEITAEFYDAGHILGSSFVKISAGGIDTIFSGDLGNTPSPLVKETEVPPEVQYMVIESVYGDRLHENRNLREERLKEAIEYITKSKGTLVIPAFSLERTQIILNEMNDLVESGKIQKLAVFLDSPLAIKLTDIYRRSSASFNTNITEYLKKDDDVFDFPGLVLTRSQEESREIFSSPGPKVIIAGSGMSSGGRVIHHEKHFLENPENMILFVGYQSPGSLGREIQNGSKSVTIFNKKVKIRAKVDSISGYSSHADRDQLLNFVAGSAKALKKVFVAMGEPKSSMFLAQRVKDYLGIEAVVPEEGDSYTLD